MKRYVNLLLIFLFGLFLISCNEEIEKTYYTIGFDSDNGEKYENVVIEGKQQINLPTPTKEGYNFKGWYPSEKYVEGTIVTNETYFQKNVTLYAKWEEKDITINLDLDGGHFKNSELPTKLDVKAFDEIVLEKVYKDGYLFLGWYIGNQKLDQTVSFVESKNLTAKYIALDELEDEYAITLNLDGGSFYDYQTPLPDNVLNNYSYYSIMNNQHDDIVNKLVYEFIVDYANHYRALGMYANGYLKSDIFNQTYNRLIGEGTFFSNKEMYNKWRWLIQYMEFIALDINKPYLEELYKNNYFNANNSYYTESASIRIELAAFLNVNKREYRNSSGIVLFESQQYKEADILGFTKFINPTKYVPGEEILLLCPIKDGYQFMGWYDNPEFIGEAIWKIEDNDYGDKVFYAKWEE